MLSVLSSLRFRLMMLVLLALLPALCLILYGDLQRRRTATVRAHENALRLTRVAAAVQDRYIEGARQLLVALAELPQVNSRHPEVCSALFAQLREQYTIYANLGAIDANGNVFCSAEPLVRPVNVSDRSYYKRVMETRAFSASDYLVGRLTGRPSLTFALPLLSTAGQVESVAFAALDLAWLNRLIAQLHVPEGTTLTVLDRSGTILARHPDPDKWIGVDVHEAPIAKTILREKKEGLSDTKGIEGVQRLYAFTTLSGILDTGAYVYAGIPESVAYAEEDRLLVEQLISLALVGLLSMGAAWFAGGLFVVRRANALVRVAERLAGGDMSARTGLTHGLGELGKLAAALDRMADSLERNQEFTRTLLENLAEGVVACDAQGKLTLFNRAARQWHGLEAGHLPPEQWSPHYNLFGPDAKTPLPREDVPLYRAFSGEGVRGAEMSIVREGWPPRRIVANGDPLFDAAGRKIGAVVAMHDVTERKAAEEQLRLNAEEVRRLNAELEQRVAQRTLQLEAVNKELEAFSYSVSHDLRAPLRAIEGFSRILLRRYGEVLDAEGQDFLQRIRVGSQQMDQLIEDLLRLSRVTRTDIRRNLVDLGRLAREIMSDLQDAEPNRAVQVVIEDAMTAWGDANLIQIALENLLANAWKFTSKAPQARIEVGKMDLEGELVFFVRDNGAGFDTSGADRLFGAFQRLHTETEFPGSGIGLAIVQRVINRHGGRIWAEGKVGEGAVFYFTLPERRRAENHSARRRAP